MKYTTMPVVAWSELYIALELQYGPQFVDEEDLSEIISEDSCSTSDLVYFYIRTDRKCDESDTYSLKANIIRGYLRDIFSCDDSVIIDFVI